jgi:hypothetical protein
MAFLTDLLKQVFTTTATGAVAFRAIISGDQTIADVTVTGTLDVTGASTVTDLTVSGTLTANDIATPQVPTNIANVGSVAVISDVQSFTINWVVRYLTRTYCFAQVIYKPLPQLLLLLLATLTH